MKRCAAITLCLLLSLSTHAQNPPATPPPAGITFSTGTTLVLVPALVRTKSGALVYTLKASDFTLTDNGVEQKLSLEEGTDTQPLALVIAVETGGAGAQQIAKLENIQNFLEAMVGGVRHRVAVVSFDSAPVLQQNFTDKMDKITHAMHSLSPGDKDAAILDTLNYSVNLLRQQPPEFRRAILLISETVDQGSHIQLDQALRAVSDTNTTVYALAYPSASSSFKHEMSLMHNDPTPGPPGGCMSRKPAESGDNSDGNFAPTPDTTAPSAAANTAPKAQQQTGTGKQAWNCFLLLAPPIRAAQAAALATMKSMRKDTPETVAKITGGEFYKIESVKSITKDLMTITNHVPNRYVLSFTPTALNPGPHTIQLTLKNYADLTVSARSSYWIDDDTAAAPTATPAPAAESKPADTAKP